jgi:hypothetical protein
VNQGHRPGFQRRQGGVGLERAVQALAGDVVLARARERRVCDVVGQNLVQPLGGDLRGQLVVERAARDPVVDGVVGRQIKRRPRPSARDGDGRGENALGG